MKVDNNNKFLMSITDCFKLMLVCWLRYHCFVLSNDVRGCFLSDKIIIALGMSIMILCVYS
jgi:hypothetical protein